MSQCEDLSTWLAGIENENTRAAYGRAWDDLLAHAQKPGAALIGVADVRSWRRHLAGQGLSAATINQRLSAISSFYLATHARSNPVSAIQRPEVDASDCVQTLDVNQVLAFLSAIDTGTQAGRRDYALFLAYLVTGRSDVRLWSWGDIRYALEGPGSIRSADGEGWDRLPEEVWHALLQTMTDEDRGASGTGSYMFSAVSSAAVHLDQVGPDWRPGDQPLSRGYVLRLVKKYAHLAGLDPDRVNVRVLLHSANKLILSAGGRPQDVHTRRSGRSFGDTVRYCRTLVQTSEDLWASVADYLKG